MLDRWGGPLNGSKIGPVHENDDIMLTCRVVGGELLRSLRLFRFLWTFLLVFSAASENDYARFEGEKVSNFPFHVNVKIIIIH